MATRKPTPAPDPTDTPNVPAVLDITPLVENSALPVDDSETLLGILARIADKLGCDIVPRDTTGADHGGEIVVRR